MVHHTLQVVFERSPELLRRAKAPMAFASNPDGSLAHYALAIGVSHDGLQPLFVETSLLPTETSGCADDSDLKIFVAGIDLNGDDGTV